MKHIRKLLHFVRPYWRRSLVALVLLIAVVLMDLAIPRLIQRIIDQGIHAMNMQVVITTTIIMLVISALQTVFAIGQVSVAHVQKNHFCNLARSFHINSHV